MSGKVTLVGAGPGDKGLITVKGRAALENAEVVVYDRLVGEDIIAIIPKTAEKINAGKRSSHHLLPQEEINRILLEKAREGKNVVRLKGGDPFVFGRGGEELAALCESGIDFEVVPGVTSALAVPAYAGIPVTHRDFVSSVHIITGHARAGKKVSIDFDSCVKMGGTLVFLMGVANLTLIANGLKNAGMREDMPCAVIENGTLSGQRKFIGTLSTITETAEQAKSPSVIIVGEVCALSGKFDWFSRLPLKGRTVCVTRPADRTGTISEKLLSLGARVLEYPCIENESVLDAKKTAKLADKLKEHTHAVFTSPFGAKSVCAALMEHGYDMRVFGGVRIAAIGQATAAELRKNGINADIVPDEYDSAGLGEALCRDMEPDSSALLLRADIATDELCRILRENGRRYENMTAYSTRYTANGSISEEINSRNVDYVTFTSASTARAFAKAAEGVDKSAFTGVCIGERTAAEARRLGFSCIVSERASIDSMIDRIIKEEYKDED